MRPVTTWYSTDKRWDNRPSTVVGQAPSRDNYKGPAANKVIEDIDRLCRLFPVDQFISGPSGLNIP
jgi:hypothetical protein